MIYAVNDKRDFDCGPAPQDYRAIIYRKLQFGKHFLAKPGLYSCKIPPKSFLQKPCAEIALHSVRQDGGDNLVFAVFFRHLFARPDIGAG